jgi:hypothetical protein
LWGKIHINRGRVGEERRGKEMDRCPLTLPPTLLYYLQGPQPKPMTFISNGPDNFLEVGSPKVINFWSPPSLIPEQHQTSLRHIGTGLHDTMAPSAIT